MFRKFFSRLYAHIDLDLVLIQVTIQVDNTCVPNINWWPEVVTYQVVATKSNGPISTCELFNFNYIFLGYN